MNKERLNILQKALRKHVDNGLKFNMGVWWDEREWCGTSACALGLASTIPEFQKQGLKRKRDMITYNGVGGFYAAEEFFELSPDQSGHIFSCFAYKGRNKTKAATVSRRIRELIRTNGEIHE